MKRAVLATAILCALAGRAFALDLTRQEIAACYPDAVRFCGVNEADRNADFTRQFWIGTCMLRNRKNVRPRCLAVFKAHGF